jgi:hypothetical protein
LKTCHHPCRSVALLWQIVTADGKEYPVKQPTPRQAKAVLRPYAVELGYLAATWNQLHHNLSSLFTLLLKSKNERFAQVIWHATDSDFTQRKMLRAIIETDKKLLPMARTLQPTHAAEILWILDQIDEKLRHKRNNALHAPPMVVTGVLDGRVRSWVEAHFTPSKAASRQRFDSGILRLHQAYRGAISLHRKNLLGHC